MGEVLCKHWLFQFASFINRKTSHHRKRTESSEWSSIDWFSSSSWACKYLNHVVIPCNLTVFLSGEANNFYFKTFQLPEQYRLLSHTSPSKPKKHKKHKKEVKDNLPASTQQGCQFRSNEGIFLWILLIRLSASISYRFTEGRQKIQEKRRRKEEEEKEARERERRKK